MGFLSSCWVQCFSLCSLLSSSLCGGVETGWRRPDPQRGWPAWTSTGVSYRFSCSDSECVITALLFLVSQFQTLQSCSNPGGETGEDSWNMKRGRGRRWWYNLRIMMSWKQVCEQVTGQVCRTNCVQDTMCDRTDSDQVTMTKTKNSVGSSLLQEVMDSNLTTRNRASLNESAATL